MGSTHDPTSWALLALSLAAPGCKDCLELPPAPGPVDPQGPPQLVEARFLDGATLELTFSEPLAPVDGVNPRKFRLSMARWEQFRSYGRCYTSTDYCELSDGFTEYSCSDCDDRYQDCPAPTEVTGLTLADGDDTKLRLTLDPPLDPFRCLQLQYAPDSGLFVHYAELDIPTIEDVDGQALEDIAPHWVLSGDRNSYREDALPARSVFLPIPCPEDF